MKQCNEESVQIQMHWASGVRGQTQICPTSFAVRARMGYTPSSRTPPTSLPKNPTLIQKLPWFPGGRARASYTLSSGASARLPGEDDALARAPLLVRSLRRRVRLGGFESPSELDRQWHCVGAGSDRQPLQHALML